MGLLKAAYNRVRGLMAPILMARNKSYAGHDIGVGSYGKPAILFEGAARLSIGNYCSIARGVTIVLGGNHRSDWVTTYPFSVFQADAAHIAGHPATRGDVSIGHDVWIASDALILSGVTIGNGAVIGARAVVSRDVAPYEVVAGNPARHVRYRFDAATIERLEKLAWWHWPQEKINSNLALLLSDDIERLLSTHGV